MKNWNPPPSAIHELSPGYRNPGYFHVDDRVWVYDNDLWLEGTVKKVFENGFVRIVCRASVSSGYDNGHGLEIHYQSAEIWSRLGDDLPLGLLTGLPDLTSEVKAIWDPHQQLLIVWGCCFLGEWQGLPLSVRQNNVITVQGTVRQVFSRCPVALQLDAFPDQTID